MIIVKLRGGLSNQMFQYAAGRRLAHIHNTELKLDIGCYLHPPSDATPRNFELDKFCVKFSIASKNELIGLDGIKRTPIVDLPIAIFRKFKPLAKFISEKHFHFDESVLHLNNNVCLFGYWVSEKYFKDIESIIRKEFVLKNVLAGINKKTAQIISDCNSVSVHVRRGDYVSNQKINLIHGTCGVEYYIKCFEFICQRVKNPVFFVFSDDIKWAKENFPKDKQFHFIENNTGLDSCEDIRLMSLCKHNVIANSGFSWWGAWLNNNQNKIVCSPAKWFNNTDYNTKDVVPFGWEKF